MLTEMGTLSKMVALVVILAAVLCAAVSLRSPEIEENFYSPLLDGEIPSQEDTRIIDGKPAYPEQFRHHAEILGDDRKTFGGSLIKPTAILTCGWCSKYKKFTIVLGTIFRKDDSAFKVQSIWALVHPEYKKKKYRNDVAVILLNVEVPLGKSIWPVKLPSFDEVNKTFTGRRALISGFGKVNSTVSSPKGRLRFAEVTVISNDLCQRFYNEGRIVDSTLCAGHVNTGFCAGDYGGALVIKTGGRYKQIGIASFKDGSCNRAVPGAYARVTSFLEWIQRAAGELDDWEVDEYSWHSWH